MLVGGKKESILVGAKYHLGMVNSQQMAGISCFQLPRRDYLLATTYFVVSTIIGKHIVKTEPSLGVLFRATLPPIDSI
jgi:hypothetical protein